MKILCPRAAFVYTFVFVLISGISSPATAAVGIFVGGLSGDQTVPPVNSSALGNIEIVPLNEVLGYVLNVTNIENVTGADMHIGGQGENGAMVATLFESLSPSGAVNGTLSKGNITSESLQGPISGKEVSGLVDLMQRGNVYLNVTTVSNPTGEIRGQIGFAGIDESGTTLGEQNLPPIVLEVD